MFRFIKRTVGVWDDKISPIGKIGICFDGFLSDPADFLKGSRLANCTLFIKLAVNDVNIVTLNKFCVTSIVRHIRSPLILYFIYSQRVQFSFIFIFSSSAGVGRTGVLIFMETAFNMIEGAEPIFPLEIVRKMRDQRCSLIQTPVS